MIIFFLVFSFAFGKGSLESLNAFSLVINVAKTEEAIDSSSCGISVPCASVSYACTIGSNLLVGEGIYTETVGRNISTNTNITGSLLSIFVFDNLFSCFV
jgi:hypothetical protein